VGEPGTLFLENDTRFQDELQAFVFPIGTGTADAPNNAVVGMTHSLKFDIVTSGNITPTWKLVRVSTTSSPLFSSSRDRTQQIIITLGPIQKNAGGPPSLAAAAQNSHNSQELAAAIVGAKSSN